MTYADHLPEYGPESENEGHPCFGHRNVAPHDVTGCPEAIHMTNREETTMPDTTEMCVDCGAEKALGGDCTECSVTFCSQDCADEYADIAPASSRLSSVGSHGFCGYCGDAPFMCCDLSPWSHRMDCAG